MKPMKTLILGASVLALGLGVSVDTAQATQGTSEYVKNVDIDFTGPQVVINVENKSQNKHVNSVSLDVKDSKIDIGLDGFVECKDANNVEFLTAQAYFGGVGIGGFGQLVTTSTLHEADIDVAYKEKGNVPEATEDTFSVPLNKIKNGHPALRVDPLEEIEKARQAFNGTDVDFYKQNREVMLQRPVSIGAVCGKLNKPDQRSVGFETKNVSIKIKYKGDPAVNDVPVLNAQLGQNNMPNQVQQNPDLPFQLAQAEFQPNIPHHFGKCLPDKNPKIRINFVAAGGKNGLVDLRIKEVGNQYADYGYFYETQDIAKQPGQSHLDFDFPLIEMLSMQKYSFMAIANGDTYNHNMLIQARYKPFNGGEWSQWKDYGTATFKHRCTPQVGVQVGGQGGKLGFDNGGNAPQPGMKVQAKPQEAQADYYLKIPPIDGESENTPAPERNIQQKENEAGLLLPAVQKAREAAGR